MNVAVRRHTKAGICAATTATIVVSPLLPSVPAVAHLPALPSVSTAAVQLTAAYNPLQPWLEAFNAASANAQRIGGAVAEAPAVLLQQFLANQISHVGAILQNPGNIGSVLQDVGQNVKSAITAATLLGTQPDDWTIAGSNDVWHGLVAQMIPNMLPTAGNAQASAIVTQVINVLASPLSGVLMGLVGPGISPVVALVNSITKIANSLVKGDAMTAAQTVVNIPAAMVNGFLNGANLNLDVLAPLITKTMPAGNALQKLNLQFGGLFTAGTTGMDLSGIGGSILNSLGLTAVTTLAPDDPLAIAGQGIGPIGALVNLSHLLAKAIGWSGAGNPLAPKAPAANPTAATQVSITKATTDNSITSIPQPALAVTQVKATAAEAPETPAKPAAPAKSEKSEAPSTPATPAGSETPAKSGSQKPGDQKPDDQKPADHKADPTKSDDTKSETKTSETKPDSTKPDSTKSETKKSDTKKPETKPSKPKSEKPKPVKKPTPSKAAAGQSGSGHAGVDSH